MDWMAIRRLLHVGNADAPKAVAVGRLCVDAAGQTIDFLLTAQRDERAAVGFLTKAIRRRGALARITIDGSRANAAAVAGYNAEYDTTIEVR